MVDKMLCACRHVLQKRLMQREGCVTCRVLTAATRGPWQPTAPTHASSFTVTSRSQWTSELSSSPDTHTPRDEGRSGPLT